MFKSLEIYNFLVDNCIGYENRVNSNYLMEKFHINDNKTFRSYIESARNNPVCELVIGSEAGQNGGYWIATTEKEKTITYNNLMLRADKMIKNAQMLKGKKLYGDA